MEWSSFSGAEVTALADDLLIHVTGFFRDAEAWAALRERVIVPLIASRDNDATVRCWVSACSSGEEAYSLAMLLVEEAERAAKHLDGLTVDGFALHLPMSHGSHLSEVRRLLDDIVASGIDARRVYVSHLTDPEMASLRTSYGDFELRPRIGTRLWLGDRSALRVGATIIDCHEVDRGDVFGYRGRSAPKHGHIVVVSGGTANGIGLEAPTGGATLKDRAARIAKGGLDAAGFVRSPFTIAGKQRLFAEPPHMQASMLFLSHGAHVPSVGDEVDVRVRYTATCFDETVID